MSATFVSNSKNGKLAGNARVDATYASITASCDRACPLKDKGCYAQLGNTAFTTNRLDRAAENKTPEQVARAEAKAINFSYDGGAVPNGRQLRLHVSGDCRTNRAAKIVSKSIDGWYERGGGDVWTYTHSWRKVSRESWGKVSVLASMENPADAKDAIARGYAPAVIVAEHKSDKAGLLPGSDVEWIPCPSQTRGVACSDCGLCQDSAKLLAGNKGIAFAAHGVQENKVKRYLEVLK
jgi:hypothetical protein